MGLFLLAGTLLSSCQTNDDDEVAVSDQCYISSFALQSVMQVRHTLSSTGEDSTYTVKTDGSYFPMTIDHRSQTIENRDSLPFGSIVDAVLVTASYSGRMLSYRPANETADSLWKFYSTKDSVNFSSPQHFSVTAMDGKNYRIYTVKVNVHQQEGDSLYWLRSDSIVPGLDAMTTMKAVSLENRLLVLGQTEGGALLSVRDGLGVSGNWSVHAAGLPDDADLSTLQMREGVLYLSTRSGRLLASTDGLAWEEKGRCREGMKLVAVSDNYFYAYVDGMLCRSEDAVMWSGEDLDEEMSKLPQQEVHALCYAQSNGNTRLFLSGAVDGADPLHSFSWAKTWRASVEEGDAMWMYYEPAADNPYQFPLLQDQALFPYDGKLVTFGGKRKDKEGESMGCFYVSRDNGITWKADLNIHLPVELKGVEGPLTATVDENQYIWIIADKQVWRGRLNRLGFEQP